MSDYRGGDALAADVMKQLRQDSSRLKSTKPKATITLQFKGLTVFDEKSKVFNLKNCVCITLLLHAVGMGDGVSCIA